MCGARILCVCASFCPVQQLSKSFNGMPSITCGRAKNFSLPSPPTTDLSSFRMRMFNLGELLSPSTFSSHPILTEYLTNGYFSLEVGFCAKMRTQ
jgi:hypothetical protein